MEKEKGNYRVQQIIEHESVVYADDVTTIIVADSPEATTRAANQHARDLKRVLRKNSLPLNMQKSRNILFNPYLPEEGVFRRRDNAPTLTTTRRVAAQLKAESRFITHRLEFNPHAEPAEDTSQEENRDKTQFPFLPTESLRVLGVQIGAHFKNTITKGPTRQGIPHRVTNSRWGVEVRALKITHDAVIGSLLRYALVVTGSCYPGDLM